MVDFLRRGTKKSLLAMLKNLEGDSRLRRLLYRLVEAVMFKEEYEEYSSGSAGFVKTDGTTPLTANWDAGAYEIRAQTLESDVTTGTAPLTIASTTVVANLNVDQVDGKDETDFVLVDGTRDITGNFTVDADLEVTGDLNVTGESEFTDQVDFLGNAGTAGIFTTNTINERTADSGVTIESVLVKDGGVTIAGQFAGPVTTQTDATLTLDATHYTVLCDATSNTVTISLPAASGCTGRIYNIKAINVDNTVSIDPNGSEEIDGDSTTMTLDLMESVTIQSDGSNWWII